MVRLDKILEAFSGFVCSDLFIQGHLGLALQRVAVQEGPVLSPYLGQIISPIYPIYLLRDRLFFLILNYI